MLNISLNCSVFFIATWRKICTTHIDVYTLCTYNHVLFIKCPSLISCLPTDLCKALYKVLSHINIVSHITCFSNLSLIFCIVHFTHMPYTFDCGQFTFTLNVLHSSDCVWMHWHSFQHSIAWSKNTPIIS